MPRRIELSRAALADFDAIYDYIARDNPRPAAEVLRALDRFNCSQVSQNWEKPFVTGRPSSRAMSH
jgi:plasmid stabilization system protein ParE